MSFSPVDCCFKISFAGKRLPVFVKWVAEFVLTLGTIVGIAEALLAPTSAIVLPAKIASLPAMELRNVFRSIDAYPPIDSVNEIGKKFTSQVPKWEW